MRFSEIPIATPGKTDFVVGVTSTNVDARFPVSAIGSRSSLATNTNFFISVTGSNSNDGLTPATAWATLQHAMLVIAFSIDIAGVTITNNIGPGTFVGVGQRTTVGGGVIGWIGAGSSLTTIINGPSDGLLNSGEPFSFYLSSDTNFFINKIKIAPTVAVVAVLDIFATVVVNMHDISGGPSVDIVVDCTNVGNNPVWWIDAAGATVVDTGVTYIGGGGSILAVFEIESNAIYTLQGSPSVSGSLTVNQAFAEADTGGTIVVISNPVTGPGVVGPRYLALSGAVIAGTAAAGSMGPNFFPGTVAGTADPSASYDGYMGAISGSGLPTTTNFPDPGTGGLYKDTSGGGVYSVYNDAGVIKKVALT